MSFCVDLWNGFDIIKSSIFLNHKRVKQLLDILTIYSTIEKEYIKSLENLYKNNENISKESNNSNLDNSLFVFITSLKIESEIHKRFYNNITKNLTEIKEKLEKIKIQITPYFNENIQNKELFTKALNNLILKQDLYNKSCKYLCYYLAENEAHRIIEEKSNNNKENKDKDKESIDSKNKKDANYKDFVNSKFVNYINNNLLNKKENLVKKLLDNKNEYIKCISETDKEREKYNKITEDILNNLQNEYKSLIVLFQTLIHNYIKEKINIHNELIEINKVNDIETYAKINDTKQTFDFIIKNATKEFPLDKLEFISYKINKNKINKKLAKYSNVLTNEDQNKIINEITNILKDNKLSIHEKENLQISFINRSITERYNKKIEKLNQSRRSGSTDMLKNTDIKLISNINQNLEFNKEDANLSALNLEVKNNKDDIMLDKEIEKNKNFDFIKDFVFKLVISKDDVQKILLYDIYSDNSSDEKENENNEDNDNINEDKDDDINKESYAYNELLFGFMDLIAITNKDHNEYLDYFIRMLSVHRSKGYFLLNENTYKIFLNIFNYILVNYKTSNNIIKNIILFSQTFYKNDSNNPNNKIYILNGLRDHTSFNNPETWHRAINYNLSLSIKSNNPYSLNIENKEEYMKNLKKLASNTIITYLYDLKLSTTDKNVYEEVKNFYINIYNLDGKNIEEQLSKLCGEEDDNKNEKKIDDKKDGKNDKEKKVDNKKDGKNEKEKKVDDKKDGKNDKEKKVDNKKDGKNDKEKKVDDKKDGKNDKEKKKGDKKDGKNNNKINNINNGKK